MLEKVEAWKAILQCLVKVGSGVEVNGVDYFSSLIPRHLRSYARMVEAEYGAEATREQLSADWARHAVTDVLSRVAKLDDDYYRRGVRILQHFIDFSSQEASENAADFHTKFQVRFDIYSSMDQLRSLGKEDDSSYEQAVAELHALESAVRLGDQSSLIVAS